MSALKDPKASQVWVSRAVTDVVGIHSDFLYDYVSSDGLGGKFLPDHHQIASIQQHHHFGFDGTSIHLGLLHFLESIVVLRRE